MHNPRTDFVCMDIETNLPPEKQKYSCLTYYDNRDEASGIGQWEHGLDYFEERLREAASGEVTLVNHNIPFDLYVLTVNHRPELLPLVFEAYDRGCVLDTYVNEKVIDIRLGEYDKEHHMKIVRERRGVTLVKYGLADLCGFHFDVVMKGKKGKKGEEALRDTYGPLRDVPLNCWPQEHLDYAEDDPLLTSILYESQEWLGGVNTNEDFLEHLRIEARAAWAFELINRHGIRVDKARVAAFEIEVQKDIDRYVAALLETPFLIWKKRPAKEVDGTKEELFDAVCRSLPEEPKPKTSINWLLRAREESLDEDDIDVINKWLKTGQKKAPQYDAVTAAFGGLPPMTDAIKPRVKTDAATLKEAAERSKCSCGAMATENARNKDLPKGAEPVVITCKVGCLAIIRHVSAWTSAVKLMSTYVTALKKADDDGIIHPRFNSIVGTYRTSCGGPNLQNLPRRSGVRECYIPRDGQLFVTCDYDTLELRTLAESCYDYLGWSFLGDALNAGLDPHLALAADLMHISYEEALALKGKKDPEVNHYRNLAKIANFGFPGGLTALSFQSYAKGYGVEISLEESQDLHRAWKTRWPEVLEFFEILKSECAGPHGGYPSLAGINVIRGGVSFTEACNFKFQGLAAIGAKEALYNVVKECYVVKSSPLYGCRVVAFIHDEIILEAPIGRASDAGKRLSVVMCEQMARFVKRVPITAAPALMKCWNKKAEPKYNEEGELIL